MDSLSLLTPAKINLRLEIIGKRADGYHDIQTIFQKISLYDEITFTLSPCNDITVTVDDASVPSGKNNIVYKAARLFMQDQNLSAGVTIDIKKKIPAGAGLGGGSSNAAATLTGLNKLFNCGLKQDYLFRLSQPLGADVPFFLSGYGTARASGTGEILTPVSLETKLWFLVIFPGFSISTAWAYNSYSNNILTKRKKNTIYISSIKNTDDIVPLLLNDFERVVIPRYPVIETTKNELIKAGAVGSLLSGSGSSVFGIFSSKKESANAPDKLPYQANHKAFIVHS